MCKLVLLDGSKCVVEFGLAQEKKNFQKSHVDSDNIDGIIDG